MYKKKEERIYPLDRFIPFRKLIDFDGAYDKLSDGQPEKEGDLVMNASELSRNHKQQELWRQLNKLSRINERIFKMSVMSNAEKPSPSKIRLWPCRPRKKPVIRDERVLDLADSNLEYHLNSIDWGRNDCLATSVGHKVLIGKYLDSYKVSTETVFEFQADRATAVSWSPDGLNLAFGSETGLILDWHAVTKTIILEQICCFRQGCCITAIHWHPNSKIYAWGCSKGRLTFRSINDEVCMSIEKAHRGGILSLKYSPGGNYICSSGFDNYLRVWKGTSYNAYMEIEMGSPSKAIAWHPWRTGLLAVGEGPSAPGSLSLWNVNTAKPIFLRHLPDSASITAVTFNKETGELVFAQLRETPDERNGGKCDIYVLGGPNYVSDSIIGVYGVVCALIWNADSSKLGAAITDETFRIWNFLKAKNRKRSFNESREDLNFLALKRFKSYIR